MSPTRSMNSRGALLVAGISLAAIGVLFEPAHSRRVAAQGTGDDDGTPVNNQDPFPNLPALPTMGNADSNNSMIAVTGIDVTGSSILYLVDTVNRQIAIYQASGGPKSSQGIKFVGARRIDLDLQLNGLNDQSEYKYEDLEKEFAKNRAAGASTK